MNPMNVVERATDWRIDGVKVVRAERRGLAKPTKSAPWRATAFEFFGSGGTQTWIGTFTLTPGANTGAHHHGRHEVAVYVVTGRARIRWGNRLEFAALVGAGDFVYFPPYVPHEEQNLNAIDPVEFVVIRSDNAGIRVDLDIAPVESPEMVTGERESQ